MLENPSAVLFACTFNAVRSPMAEGVLRSRLGNRMHVESIGVREGMLDPFAVKVMDEVGIDISRHEPRTFADLEDEFFDLIISLSPEAHHQAMELTRMMACDVVFWNTFDPTLIEGSREVRLSAYRQVRDQLASRIEQRFPLGKMGSL